MDKKSMVFIVAALAAAFLIGANTNSVPDEIKAKRFVVVGDDGKVMLVLGSIEDGGSIGVVGKDEKLAALISSSENGGDIFVYGKDEKVAASIGSNENGGIIFVYDADPDSQGSVLLTTNTEGGLIAIDNKTGETVVALSADEYGNGVVGAYNRKGVGRTLQPGP